MRYGCEDVGGAAPFRGEARVGHGWNVQVQTEILGQFVALENLVEQSLVARSEQDGVVSHILVSDVGPEIEDKQRHGPVHFFEFLCSFLSRFGRGVQVLVRVVHICVGDHHVKALLPARSVLDNVLSIGASTLHLDGFNRG